MTRVGQFSKNTMKVGQNVLPPPQSPTLRTIPVELGGGAGKKSEVWGVLGNKASYKKVLSQSIDIFPVNFD